LENPQIRIKYKILNDNSSKGVNISNIKKEGEKKKEELLYF